MRKINFIQLVVFSILATTAVSFNFKGLFQTLESPFVKENSQEHALSHSSPLASFVQKEKTENTNFVQNKAESEVESQRRSHAAAKQETKVERIMDTINGLNEVKSSCEQLIEAGSIKMEKDYQQCITTVHNFNCSYSNEWAFLKEKHTNNVTLMEEEIKAKEEAIEAIKQQVQKKSEGKQALIKAIMPEISKIQKDIGQVELIIELIEEIQEKKNTKQEGISVPAAAPAPQLLIKNHEKKVEIHPPRPQVQKKEANKKEKEAKTKERVGNEEMEDFSNVHNILQEGIEERVQETNSEESQPAPKQNQLQSVKAIQFQKQEQPEEKAEEPIQEKNASQELSDFSSLENDEAVETIDEQFDQDNINDLIDDIQNRNLFDDSHVFVQTKMKLKAKRPEVSIFEAPLQSKQKSLAEQILDTKLVSNEDKESLWLIAREEKSLNPAFENFVQTSQETLQNSLDIKLIKEKIQQQEKQLIPSMIEKLQQLNDQLKKQKEEKDTQIQTLESLIQEEYQIYAEKIFEIQVEKHKIVEEIQKKHDWINQLSSKMSDCENQDTMLKNCENTKAEDISYLKELQEFKAIAEGSLQQLNQLLDYKNVPIVKQSEEKPAEEKPAEEKPAEEKPAEEKPAEEKPAEEKPAEEKPAEEKPAEEKPAEEKPAEEKPAEEKPAEEKPAEEKPAEEKPTEEKPAEEKPAEEKPAEEKPAEEKPAEEKPAEEKPAEEKPAEEKPAEEKPAEEKPAEEKPAEEKPAEEKPAEEKPAEEKPAEEKPAEEKPAEEKPAEEKPAEEKPAEEKPAEEKPAEEEKAVVEPEKGGEFLLKQKKHKVSSSDGLWDYQQKKIPEHFANLKKMKYKSKKEENNDVPILVGSDNYDPQILSQMDDDYIEDIKEIPDFVEELDESFNPSAELEKYSDMQKLPEKKLSKKYR